MGPDACPWQYDAGDSRRAVTFFTAKILEPDIVFHSPSSRYEQGFDSWLSLHEYIGMFHSTSRDCPARGRTNPSTIPCGVRELSSEFHFWLRRGGWEKTRYSAPHLWKTRGNRSRGISKSLCHYESSNLMDERWYVGNVLECLCLVLVESM